MKNNFSNLSSSLQVIYRSLCLLAILLATGLQVLGQSNGTNDSTFNTFGSGVFSSGIGLNNGLASVAVQSDDKVLIGGFGGGTTYNGSNVPRALVRLNANGSVDSTFNSGGAGVTGTSVLDIYPLATGQLLIAGNFTGYNGDASIKYIAKLNADGTPDLSFNSGGAGPDNQVNTIAVQPDGKILIGGAFTTYNGTTRIGIARLNADGSLDTGFDPGTGVTGASSTNPVYTVALQSNGKIIIGGNFTAYNGTARNYIARLNADGSLDASFATGAAASGSVNSLALRTDGKIIIGGSFTSYDGTSRTRIARLDTLGALDASFNPGTGAASTVSKVLIQPSDGKILLVGAFTTFNGVSRSRIARLNTNGSLDTGLNPGTGASSQINSLALQSNGKIIMAPVGTSVTYNGITVSNPFRIDTDGSLDLLGFNPTVGPNGDVNAITVQSDGKALIGGTFTTYNATSRSRIARLNTDGSLDAGFNPGTGAGNVVNAIVLQSDGKILIGGSFASYNGTPASCIARLNADGSLDTSFNSTGSGANNVVNAIVIQSDGKILIGGGFTSYNGTAANRLARLNADGSLDGSFATAIGTGAGGTISTIRTIALQSDGKILVGGDFTTFNTTASNRIVRLNTDGSRDNDFTIGTGASASVYRIVVQSDEKILISGNFTSYNGAPSQRIARLNTDGTLDTGFNPGIGANGLIKTIALQFDEKILIGGDFTTFDGATINRIARVNMNGTRDTTFTTGVGTNFSVNTLARQPDGNILIGGNFTRYNGVFRNRIARLLGTPCTNPTSGGTIGSAQSICPNIAPAGLTELAAPTGSYTGTLVYQWQSSTTSASAGFTDISGATSATYSPGALATTTWFRRQLRVDCETTWVLSNAVEVTVSLTAVITNNTGNIELTCARTAISLTASGGDSYLWSGGLGSDANASVTIPDVYTVTVTDANGCTDTESIIITQDITTPTAVITNNTGSTELTCSRTAISLTAGGAVSYVWSGGLGSNAGASVTSPGTYTVTATASNGCTDMESIIITQNITTPTAVITNNTGSTELTCSRTAISLTASGAVSYAWSGGLGSNAAASVTSHGTYTVTATAANGCTDTESITITQDISAATPVITVSGVTTFCDGGQVQLTSSAATSYSWSTGANTASIQVGASGAYMVTVTYSNGCTAASVSTSVTVIPNTSNTTSVTDCFSYTWSVNSQVYTQSATYTSVTVCHTEILNLQLEKPQFTQQPSSASHKTTPGIAMPAYTVAVSGGSGHTYQWYRNTTQSNTGGTLIPGAQSTTYLPPTQSTGTTYYYVRTTTSNGCQATSEPSGFIQVCGQ